MKNILGFAAITFIAAASQADIIKCTFTEPFIDTTYSMAQQSLTYSMFTGEKPEVKVIKNVSFQIKSAGEFELVAKDGTVLQKISLNNKGSDGMSDRSYPYEVEDKSMGGFANSGWGGCSSNFLKATEDSGSK